ncbi:TPA: hypothetical protein ACIGUS_001051 [Escherichia coli]
MQEIKENIRQQLYGFYIAYDLWLSNGAKPGGVFSRNYGLCANLFDYLTSIGTSSEAALEQLHVDFRSAGLYEVLPFNESKGHYYEEKGNNMCHMNPARVAWVRVQIAQEQGIEIAINELVSLSPQLDKRAAETLSMAVAHLRKLVKKQIPEPPQEGN